MNWRSVIIGAILGSIVGVGAAISFGPSGWVLGGGVTGVVVGLMSPDLAAAIFHSAGSGSLAGLVFALIFGLGIGVQFTLATGEIALLAWGINPFLAVALVYGPGCAVIASIVGGCLYMMLNK